MDLGSLGRESAKDTSVVISLILHKLYQKLDDKFLWLCLSSLITHVFGIFLDSIFGYI